MIDERTRCPPWCPPHGWARLSPYQRAALLAGYDCGIAGRFGRARPEFPGELTDSSLFDTGEAIGFEVTEEPDPEGQDGGDVAKSAEEQEEDDRRMPAFWVAENGNCRIPNSEDLAKFSRGANRHIDERTWNEGPHKAWVTVESTPESRRAERQAERDREEAADGTNPRTGNWRPRWENYAPQDPESQRERWARWRKSKFKAGAPQAREAGKKGGKRRSRAKAEAARANARQPRPRGRRPRRKRT